MAEANHKQDMCSICLETCKQPTTIACEHKFCQHCLQDYAKKYNESGERQTIPCPICRTEIPYFEETGQASGILQECTAPMCDVCKENDKTSTAVVRCRICSEDLCCDCEKYHRTMRATKKHQLTDIEVTLMDNVEDVHCSRHASQRYTCFCEDHQRLCCDQCFEKEHKDCANINKFKQMSKSDEDIVVGVEVLRGDIRNFTTELCILANGREQAFQRLTDRKVRMRQEVEKFKDKILTKVTVELTRYLPKAECSLQKDIDEMVDDFDWCNSMKRKVELVEKVLTQESQTNAAEDRMIRYCLAQERLDNYREEIVSHQAQMREISFEYHLNEDYEAFLHLGGNLINTKSEKKKTLSTLPLYMKPIRERSLDFLFEFSAGSIDETQDCHIISAFYQPDGNVLLFDAGNKSVKLFSVNGKLKHKIDLGINAACVTRTDKAEWIASGTTYFNVALSSKMSATAGTSLSRQFPSKQVPSKQVSCQNTATYDQREVHVYGVRDNITCRTLAVQALKGCSAVIRVNDYYYSTWKTAIKVINLQGRLLQTVGYVENDEYEVKGHGESEEDDDEEELDEERNVEQQEEDSKSQIFKDCGFIAVNNTGARIYVADIGKNAVSAFGLKDGIVQLPPLFIYEQEQLEQPSCITVSRQSLVFVCGKMSDNIHILSAEGKVLNILPVSSPTSVSLLEEEQIKIVVSNEDAVKRDKVQVYRMF